jgi:hypothetical protein
VEYINIVPIMTSDNAPTPFAATAKSVTSGYEPYNAFSDNNSAWISSTDMYAWLQIDLGKPYSIEKYIITQATVTATKMREWKLEGSNTGIFNGEQIVIHYGSMDIDTKDEFIISKVEPFRYIRLTSIKTNGNNGWTAIGRLELFEKGITQKTLIKLSNEIHTLSDTKDTLIIQNIPEPLNFNTYEKWGMDNLIEYKNEINKVSIEMDESGMLEGGRVLRKMINKNEFKLNKINIK